MIQLHGVLQQQSAAGFNPQTAIGWHSFFWAEGTAMQALGYTDTAAVGTWSNETGEKNATEATNQPVWKASNTSYNNRPTVDYSAANKRLMTANFTSAPTYPISIVVIGHIGTSGSYLIDGNTGSNRAAILVSSAKWAIYGGASVQTGGTSNTSPHMFVNRPRTGSNDLLSVDGTADIDADSGGTEIIGLTLGNHPTASVSSRGSLALVGVYVGDITGHGQWSAFKTWAGSHYSLTIA